MRLEVCSLATGQPLAFLTKPAQLRMSGPLVKEEENALVSVYICANEVTTRAQMVVALRKSA